MLKMLVPAICLIMASTAEAGATLRCGSSLVSVGAISAEVQSKCGEPVSREFLGYRAALDEYGYGREVKIEEWIYGPRNGMYHYLRLEGNRLVRIESKRGN